MSGTLKIRTPNNVHKEFTQSKYESLPKLASPSSVVRVDPSHDYGLSRDL